MSLYQVFREGKAGRVITRLAYILPALIFLLLLINYRDNWSSSSSYQVPYLALFGIPAAVLIYQSIRNSLLGWWLVSSLYFICGFTLCDGFRDWQSLVVVKYDREEIYQWLLLGVVYLLIGCFYYFIRPQKRYL